MLRMILFVMCLGSAAGAIGAQELALSARGPRFLVASGRGRVVEIEPATAPVFQRRVTLALEHTTVGEALAALGREAGIRLVYSRDVLDADAPTRIKVEGITVAAALTEILFGAGVDVVLSDVNRVTLAPRQLPRRPPAGVVRGTVVDSASRVPIAGAQLAVVGTAARAVTGTDGQFTLPNVPAGEWTLQARRVGYRAAERSVRVEDGQTLSVDFALSQAASMLDEVIVAGSFLESSRREAPVPVTVLSEEEIHRPTRNRIDQLFRGDIPGVVGYDNGSFALGTAAFVRGSASLDDSNLLKVYVDGIETPANLLTSSIDLSSIERVELLRGPQASTIYGSNASGGVLLLFTKNGRRGGPHLSGSLAGGVTSSDFVGDTPTAMEHRLTLSGGGDGFTYSLGGSYDHFGEVVFQSDWQQAGAHGRAVLTQGSLNLALTAAFSRRVIGAGNFPAFVALGAPSLSAPRNEDYYLGNQLVGATLTYTPSPRWQHVVTVGFNGIDLNVNNYAPRNIFPGDTLRNASLETDDQLTLRYVTSATATLGSSVTATTTGGIDLSRRTRNYYQGDGLDDPQVGSSAQSDYIEAYRVTDNAGFFAQQVLGFGDRLFFTAGIRAEDNSNVGSEEGLIWAPRAGVAYTFDLGNDLALKPRVSYGKSIRPPQPGLAGSSQDPFFIQRANPNLRPEVQLGVDAGFDLDYRQGTLTLEATYFDQDAKDLIGLVYLSDLSADPLVTQYQNVGRVNNKGVELAAGVNVGLLSLRGSYSTVKSRIESLAQGYSGEQVPGDEMLFVARHSGGGTAGLRFTPLFASQGGRSARFELGLTYIGGRRTLDLLGLFRCLNGLDPCRGGLRAYQTNLSPFTKWRLGLSHPVSRAVEAFLNVENLTDEQVGEFVTVAPSRGRTVLVGIRFGQ